VAVLAGAAFMFTAALGIARLPDLFTRMQAATKAATVGVVGMMCGVALAFFEVPVTVRSLLVSVFFLLTAPVGAHVIARSAHTRGVPLAPGTRVETRKWARDGGGRAARRLPDAGGAPEVRDGTGEGADHRA
jgi:multicomponent Na+:H+ antiporter subunit G